MCQSTSLLAVRLQFVDSPLPVFSTLILCERNPTTLTGADTKSFTRSVGSPDRSSQCQHNQSLPADQSDSCCYSDRWLLRWWRCPLVRRLDCCSQLGAVQPLFFLRS